MFFVTGLTRIMNDDLVKSHFYCHAELVEAYRNIDDVHSPFDGLRVTAVTFYEFIKNGMEGNLSAY
jgi:hypothetical protein